MYISFWRKIIAGIRKHELIFVIFLSTTFLIASSYPLYLWPLGFIAFAPIIFFIERNPTEYKKIAWVGFAVGFLYPLVIMYFTVMEFNWLPEAHFFQTIIRFASVPVSLIIGILYGLALFFYAKRLRTKSLFKNIFILAIVWSLAEWIVTKGTGGYNLGILANVVATLPFFTSLAALGGINFVSFIVILFNCFVGFFFVAFYSPKKRHLLKKYFVFAISTTMVVIGLFIGNNIYLRYGQSEQNITIAVLQNNSRKQGAFGAFTSKDTFSFKKLAFLIKEAKNIKPSPNIIIYPFAVSKEVLTVATSSSVYVATAPINDFSDWVAKKVSGNTTFVTWNTIERKGIFSNEIDYWNKGHIVRSYKKKKLMPFIDYTPLWAQQIGLYSTVIDETPGAKYQPIFNTSSARIANAVCSEINSSHTLRDNAQKANIVFSIGSDAMFSDSFAADADFVSAQFRASENNIATVRANRFGPSGFISSDGRIIQKTNPNEDGAFVATLPFETNPRKTLYSITGDTLPIISGLIFIGILVFL